MKQSKTLLKNSRMTHSEREDEHEENADSTKLHNSDIKSIKHKTTLDLKKINLQKNPAQSQSSLQLLILLLSKSLSMTLQQILGLFTNQNKYLAYVIVKGINDKFDGIKDFYKKLITHTQLLKQFYLSDQQDTLSCLYAVKPGFISKNQEVASLTIDFFQHFNGIYSWFISDLSKCSNTLLLGFRRHQRLQKKYVKLLTKIVKGHQQTYFTKQYRLSFASPIQFLHITASFIRFLPKIQITNGETKKYLVEHLQKFGVFQKWLQTAQQVYQNQIEDKIAVLDFLSQMMQHLPQIVEKNQIIFNSIRTGWVDFRMIEFVPLFNHLLIILEKLASFKSNMARKLYNIIIDIFNDIYQIEDKRDFVVNGFMTLLGQFPTIPSDLFIQKYKIGCLNSSDFLLICQAIDVSTEQSTLIKIGQVLKQLFFYDMIANFYLGNLLPEVVKRLSKLESKQSLQFILSTIKLLLGQHVTLMIKGKSLNSGPHPNNKHQSSFGHKKSINKEAKNEINEATILAKATQLSVIIIQRIIDMIIRQQIKPGHLEILKNYLLMTNIEIKKNNYGTGSKQISHILHKKLKVTQQQQHEFEGENKIRERQKSFSSHIMEESVFSKRSKGSLNILSLSRAHVPETITKEFQHIVQKRKRDQENKKYEELKKRKQQENKKIMYKKQLQKMSLIKGGFGDGQAQLKQDGFWSKFIKQIDDLEIYTHNLIEETHLESFNLILKAHHKLVKYLFFNYSNTMYSIKSNTNFDDNQLRKQTLSSVQVIKMMKDYRLMQITNSNKIQSLIRQINVKILGRKEVVNQLDIQGFEEFIRQFCLVIWSKCRVVTVGNEKANADTSVDAEKPYGDYSHLNLSELFVKLLSFLKNAFNKRGQNTSFFEPMNENDQQQKSEKIQQLNEVLEENPNHILPEGYKKVIDKKITFLPSISSAFQFPESYTVCFQVLDEIIYEKFKLHILQAVSLKTTTATAKSIHHISVKQRDPKKIKARALSTMIDRKYSVHSNDHLAMNKNNLSKEMKKALLSIKNQDKIVGEQVAFKMEQMLSKFNPQNSKLNAKKTYRVGQSSRVKALSHRRIQSVANPPKSDRPLEKSGKDFQKIKQSILQRKQLKAEEQRKKRIQQINKVKKRKEMQQKYFQQKKQKVESSKRKEIEQKNRKAEQLKRKMDKKNAKQKFQQFNQRQVDQLSKQFQAIAMNKKKQQQMNQSKQEAKQQKFRRIRAKIQEDDRKINQIRKQTSDKIIQIYHSDQFQTLIEEYEPSLKAVFELLIKNAYRPLSDRQCKPGQVQYESWLYFNHVFEVSPLIINPKDVINIFKAVTKQKQISKEYIMGISYEEFLQCLLRQSIKQKTVFSKISQKIKDEPMSSPQNSKIGNDKKEPPKNLSASNEFQEQQQLDIKKLLKEEDVRDDIFDHYGDLEKFNIQSFKGLIYYLKMPMYKKGQQNKYREILTKEKAHESGGVNNIERLKQKLKEQYTIDRGPVKQAKPTKSQPKKQKKLNNKQSVAQK